MRRDNSVIRHDGNRNYFGDTWLQRPDPITRFFAVTEVTPTCWIYKGKRESKGYGRFNHNGREIMAHKFIYETFFGPIPKGKVCRHTCDNRKCVNPKHIQIGTQKENMQDMVNRGRSMTGEKNNKSKLTVDQVVEIKSKYKYRVYSYDKLAKEYGVNKTSIAKIINGKHWKHLKET